MIKIRLHGTKAEIDKAVSYGFYVFYSYLSCGMI